MRLSIVTSLFNSAPYINEFYARISASAKKITDDYEIILVNDGSPDDSLAQAIALHEKDSTVTVIDLSRNFGHHKALMTGLAHAQGELIFLIDSDLEENPELVYEFYNELKNNSDTDVIYGVRKKRYGSLLKRIPATLFYKIFNILSQHKVPEGLTIVRLMTKQYVENLVRHKDKEILLAGLWTLTGFVQKPFPIDKKDKGSTTYNFGRKISQFINAVTSFTSRPLLYIAYMGFFIFCVSALYIVHLLYRKAILNLPPPGYSSIIVSIWLLGGLTLCALGIVGIYIAKVFEETKDRPRTIIKKIYAK